MAKKIVVKKKNPKQTNPKSLANLRPAKKGEVRNPNGGRAHDPEKKALRDFTNETVKDIIKIALTGNLADLNAIATSKESTAFQVGIASALAKAIKGGDWGTLKNIAETLLGKPVDKLDITTNGKEIKGSNVTKVLLQLPQNGRTKEENEK